jgi:hypothetical protein
MKKILFLLPMLLLVAQTRAGLVNVALDAPAFSSAPVWNGDTVARLTDGQINLQIHSDVTPPTGFAYWIDLGTSRTIDNIKIWPRQDGCCAERLSNVRVSVHDDDGLDNIGAEVWHADLFTMGDNPGSAAGTVVTVTGSMGVGTFKGRWVKLTALGDPLPDYSLQVDELQVYAEGPANIALGAPATTSAPLYNGFNISGIVNGNRGDVVHGDATFAPTDPNETSFHYDLNLGAPATLNTIKIVARQDGCCPERLSNYHVGIHSDNAGTIGAEVWGADLHTDGSNPGSGVGSKDVLTADADPGGVFAGQWIRLTSLDIVVPAYALQLSELEAYGTLSGGVLLRIISQPQSGDAVLGRPFTFNFNVTPAGGDPALLTFQWKKNGADIPDGTNASYTTPPISTADETNLWKCVASYPNTASKTSDEVGIDIDYAFGAAAYANGPLWGPGGWNISVIVDGNHNAGGGFNGVHGDKAPPTGFAYWFDMHTQVNISNVVVWARQDGCCAGRLTNYRLSVHDDDNGAIGAEVWSADLHTDGSNPGSGLGARDVITGDLDPIGVFAGRWVKITSLEDPVQDYALQLTEIEVFGSVPPEIKVFIIQQPANASSSPFRTATFSAAAGVLNGDPQKLTYQWQRNGVNIPGATGLSYTTPPLCEDDAGAKFKVVISYPGIAPTVSDEATLSFDFNYARGSTAFANQPLWVPGNWNIGMLVDGNRAGVFHGDTGIQPGFAYTVNIGFAVEIDHIDIYPRQDGCCAERFTNLRVGVHNDNGQGAIGDEVWGADLFTDGTNPGSGPGIVVSLTADLDAGGLFAGQWIKITTLEDPVQNYALQMTELEVFGKARALCWKKSDDGKLILSWDHGTLQSASVIAGPWADVAGATSPLTVSFTGQQTFFRLRVP